MSVAATGQLGFRLLLWPLPFFDTGVLPLLLLSRPLLLPRPRPLPLPVRFFWGTLLLSLLELPVLLARPEAFEATEAFDLADLWLVREVNFTLVLELDLPDLDVKELCLEVLRVLARSTPGFLPEFGLTLMPQACCMSSLDEKRPQRPSVLVFCCEAFEPCSVKLQGHDEAPCVHGLELRLS